MQIGQIVVADVADTTNTNHHIPEDHESIRGREGFMPDQPRLHYPIALLTPVAVPSLIYLYEPANLKATLMVQICRANVLHYA